jgi:L-fucose isomerase-like protein
MLDYKIKIGLVAMRRNTTDRPRGTFLTWYSAEQRGKRFVDYIENNFKSENVSFVDNKGIGHEDLVFDDKSAEEVVERFKNEKVDAVMIINCNFGNEEAAADIAKALDKPVLLWAPLDDEYYVDGMRPTDSQCGIFGVSRQMQRFGIPFSFIRSCEVESEEFKEGFDRFVRVACMVKNFRGLRVGQIGARPAPFFSVIWNEGELMEQLGIKIIPINFAIIEQRMKTAPELYKDEIAEYESYFKTNFKLDDLTPKYITPMATLAAVYKHLFDEFRLDIISAECWTATPVMFEGLAPCAVYGLLNNLGYMVACESDLHAALTMVLLKCATLGKGYPLFGEFTVRHPENKNAELLWHCGPFPLSEKAPDSEARLVNQRIWLRAKNGKYTVARLDRETGGKYMLLPMVCNTTEGPNTH